VLPNGLRVLAARTGTAPVVRITFVAPRAGSRYEGQKLGLALLTNRALIEGTRMADGRIVARPSVNRAPVVLETEYESASVSIELLRPLLELGMVTVAGVVQRPVFPASGVDRARTGVLEGMADSMKLAHFRTQRLAEQLHWGESARIATPLADVAKGLEELTPTDVAAFHRSAYRPEQGVLIVTGLVDPELALASAARAFSPWSVEAAPSLPPHATPQTRAPQPLRIAALEHGGKNTLLWVQAAGPGALSTDRAATAVLGMVLSGTFESRLNQSLRVERGAAYGSQFEFALRAESSSLRFSTDVSNGEAGDALAQVLKTLRALRERPITEDELRVAQRVMLTRWQQTWSSRGGLAGWLADAVALGLPTSELETWEEAVLAVRPEHVQTAARRYLREDTLTVIAMTNPLESFFGLNEIAPLDHYQ
jgi:zinc protease